MCSSDLQRYNFRTNMEANFKQIGLKMQTGIDAYIVDTKEPATASGRGYYTVWSHIQNKRPWEPAYNPNGQIYSGTTDNPLVDISDQGGYYKEEISSVRGNLNFIWDLPWVEGLTLKALTSYTIVNDRNKTWEKSAQTYDWEGNPSTANKPNLSKNVYYHRNFNVQFLADYSRTFFEKHTVGATFGIEASGQDYDNSSLARKSYLFDVDQIGSGPVDTSTNGSSEGVGYRRAAFIGRLKYDYDSRYMVEFNMRHDGSDYFPKDKRWGTFFSGSAAWAVSEEGFYKALGINKVFNLLKLRASYGEIGQDSSVGRFAYVSSYGLNTRGAYLGGKWYSSFYEGNLISPDMTWYTTKDFNIGVDFATLNSSLSGSVDYFAKVTTGYIASPSNVGDRKSVGRERVC